MTLRLRMRRCFWWSLVAAAAVGVLGVGGAAADPPFWATLTPACSSDALTVSVPDGHSALARIVSSNSTVDLSNPLWGAISWRGSDTFWVPLSVGGEFSFDMACSGPGFEMDLADIQRPPVSFTGATTAGAELITFVDSRYNPIVEPGESELAFSAPINDDYTARLSLTQGAITLDAAGHKETFATSGTFDLGRAPRAPEGEGLFVETEPGAQAHWTVTITAAPLTITRAAASRRYIRPSGIDRIHYTLGSDATVDVDVHGPKGIVPLVTNLKQALGANAFHWDGLQANGKPARQGTYRIEIRAANVFGDSATRSVSIGVDTQPPRVSFGFGARARPHQRLNFRISDRLSGWKTARVYLDGRASGFHSVRSGANAFTVSSRNQWPVGRHRLTVVATDHVGNRRTYNKRFQVP